MLNIIPTKTIEAYAMIVDINGFSQIVRACVVGGVAQDVRDILAGPIGVVEASGGEVVAFMGDAFLGIIENDDQLLEACCGIAKDIDRTCEWISDAQRQIQSDWSHMPGGPSLKIAIEYGMLDVSSIESRFLRQHTLLIGEAINYASRIARFGEGNRCVLGRVAGARMAKVVAADYLEGPYRHVLTGKEHEGEYEYYFLDLGDIWRAGHIGSEDESYWG
ncbi:MAG: hypothetical protein ACLQVJ_19940 [Syntrophobacteraceae bacterium]